VKLGYVSSVRGRSGGIKLAKDASEINVGAVFRQTEPSLRLLPCFEAEESSCPITSMCRLQVAFRRGLEAFLNELDSLSVADLIESPAEFKFVLQDQASV
jgi:Rrf2 family nitric oxide-sensitive transcriptional repressor